MLDLIVCSTTLQKRVQNCYVALDGVDSNHHAVRMELNLTLQKYKEKASLNSGEINWIKICKEDKHRKLYDQYLLELTTQDMTYDNFCEAIICAGQEIATSTECKCEGWCKAGETILSPAIEEKNQLHHCLQDKNHLTPMKINQLLQQLKEVNKHVSCG